LPRTAISASRIASLVAPARVSASPAAVLPAGGFPDVLERAPCVDVERGAVGAWELLEGAPEVGADQLGVCTDLRQDARHDAAFLFEQRDQQVLGADLGVVHRHRGVPRGGNGLLGLDGELV
jgi:hypothetical protein